MEKQAKEKDGRKRYPVKVGAGLIGGLCLVGIGAVCGILMARYLEQTAAADRSTGEEILALVMILAALYGSILLHIVCHEFGHFLFGLLTGYRFSSFRIGSLMWIKENGKLRFRRLHIAGTGGQCLMTPPEMQDGKFPVVLYNLGGSIMNLLLAVISLILWFGFRAVPMASLVFLIIAVVGVVCALLNGVPVRMGAVDNDGCNAVSLNKNPEAMRAFWLQMKINELLAKGVRVKDMPPEWFAMPSEEGMKNPLIAAIGVFSCNRLMEERQLTAAQEQMEKLLAIDSGIVGIYRSLMVCDLICCELLGENRQEKLEGWLTAEQEKFMRAMKKFPSVLRTRYMIALLLEKDAGKAEQVKAQFEKAARRYPYPSEIKGERKLMQMAEAMGRERW